MERTCCVVLLKFDKSVHLHEQRAVMCMNQFNPGDFRISEIPLNSYGVLSIVIKAASAWPS